MNDLVSILIPVYNREKLIGACIESAINQTYQNIEVIVIDNASTDSTWDICKEYAKKDDRIKIFRNETNIGPVLNWKECIDKAKGIYAKILFSDDLISKDFLEETVALMKEDKEIGFVFSNVCIGENEWYGEVNYEYQKNTGKINSKEYINKSLKEEFSLVSPGAAIFRLNDLRKNLLYKERSIKSPTINDFDKHGAGPDLMLYLLTARDYSYVAYVNKTLSFFRVHAGSLSINDENKSKYFVKCYFQARIYFALLYESEMVERLLVKKWLSECKNRCWSSYDNFVEKFVFDKEKYDLNIFLAIKMSTLWLAKRYKDKKG